MDTQADNKPRERRARAEAPRSHGVHLELAIDEGTERVYGRVIDTETGEEIRQIPTEDIRRLQAIARELFGSFLDETA